MRKADQFKHLIEDITGFIETRIELFKLDIKLDMTKAMISAMYIILIISLLSFVILFMSIALAMYINHRVDSTYQGYIFVGLMYFSLMIVIILIRRFTRLPEKLHNYILSMFIQE